MPVRRFSLLNRDQLRAKRAGERTDIAACHPVFRAAIDQSADAREHRRGTR